MKETITTITYSVCGTPSTRLHIKGEIKKKDLPSSIRDDFEYTNHLGQTELVTKIQNFNINDDINVDVDVDDVENGIYVYSNINELYEAHKMYYLLSRLK